MNESGGLASREHHISVRRTARYYTTGNAKNPKEIWFLLHGYGQSASDFLDSCASLAHPDRLLVAPEGLSRFYTKGLFESPGASWMTREARDSEISDYVCYLDSVADQVVGDTVPLPASETTSSGLERPPILRVLGFSQGAATASRWIALGKVRPAALVCWAGDIAHDLPDPGNAFAGINLTMVFGSRDRLITGERREAFLEKMRQAGLTWREITFDGGHRMDDGALASVAASL